MERWLGTRTPLNLAATLREQHDKVDISLSSLTTAGELAKSYTPLPTEKMTALAPDGSTTAPVTPGVPGTKAPAFHTAAPPSVMVADPGAIVSVGTRTVPTALGGERGLRRVQRRAAWPLEHDEEALDDVEARICAPERRSVGVNLAR